MTNPIDIPPQERHERIVALKNGVKNLFLKLVEELYWFNELEQYRMKDCTTFNQYIAGNDVDIGRSTAYTLMAIYKKFRLDLKVQPDRLLEARHTKLGIICSHATEENYEELLNQADTLSKSDLRKEIRRKFGEPITEKDELKAGLQMMNAILFDIAPLGDSNQRFLFEKIKILLDKVIKNG